MDDLDTQVRDRIVRCISEYAASGQGDVISMKGLPGQFRQRVGDWRIVFALETASGMLLVQRVAHRREVYRG